MVDNFAWLAWPRSLWHSRAAKVGLPTVARSPVHLRVSRFGGNLRLNRERRLVAREGLEPSKPLGRQIYSLLRLTASLPRQLSVFIGNVMFSTLTLTCCARSMELAKGFEPPTG